MTRTFKSALSRKEEVRLDRSATFWAKVGMTAEAFNIANGFYNGSKSNIPMVDDDTRVYVYLTSRKRALAFEAEVNAIVAAATGRDSLHAVSLA